MTLTCGEELRRLEGHAGGVEVVAFTSDGKRAVSGSDDETWRVCDLFLLSRQVPLIVTMISL